MYNTACMLTGSADCGMDEVAAWNVIDWSYANTNVCLLCLSFLPFYAFSLFTEFFWCCSGTKAKTRTYGISFTKIKTKTKSFSDIKTKSFERNYKNWNWNFSKSKSSADAVITCYPLMLLSNSDLNHVY